MKKTYDGLVDYMAGDGDAGAAAGGHGPRAAEGQFPPPHGKKNVTAMMRLPFLVVAALGVLLLVKIGASTAFLAVYNQRGIISFGKQGINNSDDEEHDEAIADGRRGRSPLSDKEQETLESTKRTLQP